MSANITEAFSGIIEPDDLDHEVTNTHEAGAFLMDFFTIFFVTGFFAAQFDGGVSGFGSKTVLIAAAVTVIYFVIGKYAGGTIWQRIVRKK